MSKAFKSQKEIFEHLTRGGRVKYIKWGPSEYLELNSEGFLVNAIGNIRTSLFDTPSDWSSYHEPLDLEFEATADVLESAGHSEDVICLYVATENISGIDFKGKKFKVTMVEVAND